MALSQQSAFSDQQRKLPINTQLSLPSPIQSPKNMLTILTEISPYLGISLFLTSLFLLSIYFIIYLYVYKIPFYIIIIILPFNTLIHILIYFKLNKNIKDSLKMLFKIKNSHSQELIARKQENIPSNEFLPSENSTNTDIFNENISEDSTEFDYDLDTSKTLITIPFKETPNDKEEESQEKIQNTEKLLLKFSLPTLTFDFFKNFSEDLTLNTIFNLIKQTNQSEIGIAENKKNNKIWFAEYLKTIFEKLQVNYSEWGEERREHYHHNCKNITDSIQSYISETKETPGDIKLFKGIYPKLMHIFIEFILISDQLFVPQLEKDKFEKTIYSLQFFFFKELFEFLNNQKPIDQGNNNTSLLETEESMTKLFNDITDFLSNANTHLPELSQFLNFSKLVTIINKHQNKILAQMKDKTVEGNFFKMKYFGEIIWKFLFHILQKIDSKTAPFHNNMVEIFQKLNLIIDQDLTHATATLLSSPQVKKSEEFEKSIEQMFHFLIQDICEQEIKAGLKNDPAYSQENFEAFINNSEIIVSICTHKISWSTLTNVLDKKIIETLFHKAYYKIVNSKKTLYGKLKTKSLRKKTDEAPHTKDIVKKNFEEKEKKSFLLQIINSNASFESFLWFFNDLSLHQKEDLSYLSSIEQFEIEKMRQEFINLPDTDITKTLKIKKMTFFYEKYCHNLEGTSKNPDNDQGLSLQNTSIENIVNFYETFLTRKERESLDSNEIFLDMIMSQARQTLSTDFLMKTFEKTTQSEDLKDFIASLGISATLSSLINTLLHFLGKVISKKSQLFIFNRLRIFLLLKFEESLARQHKLLTISEYFPGNAIPILSINERLIKKKSMPDENFFKNSLKNLQTKISEVLNLKKDDFNLNDFQMILKSHHFLDEQNYPTEILYVKIKEVLIIIREIEKKTQHKWNCPDFLINPIKNFCERIFFLDPIELNRNIHLKISISSDSQSLLHLEKDTLFIQQEAFYNLCKNNPIDKIESTLSDMYYCALHNKTQNIAYSNSSSKNNFMLNLLLTATILNNQSGGISVITSTVEKLMKTGNGHKNGFLHVLKSPKLKEIFTSFETLDPSLTKDPHFSQLKNLFSSSKFLNFLIANIDIHDPQKSLSEQVKILSSNENIEKLNTLCYSKSIVNICT